jgi:hypothetical protein
MQNVRNRPEIDLLRFWEVRVHITGVEVKKTQNKTKHCTLSPLDLTYLRDQNVLGPLKSFFTHSSKFISL